MEEWTVCLAGNPNVGKSTVFNGLTGSRQHTGNWAGKTVCSATGRYRYGGAVYTLRDTPGTYSLLADSEDEAAARDAVCFGGADCTVVICDATCLERNLNLALQVLEVTGSVVLCVNLMDEAEKKRIRVDTSALGQTLGIPVIPMSARSKKGFDALKEAVAAVCRERKPARRQTYPPEIETALEQLLPFTKGAACGARWTALRLLEQNDSMLRSLREHEPAQFDRPGLNEAVLSVREKLSGTNPADRIVSCLLTEAEQIAENCVRADPDAHERDRKLDRILTSRLFGIPIMIALLMGIFWITISLSNLPSQWLSQGFAWLGEQMRCGLTWLRSPEWLIGLLLDGVYRVLSWVTAVMLPPMAIFFPLFTILEDFGYLPRVAFQLDHALHCAGACGKQALTTCMGFGCNAVGITGCRIIRSPRERLIAMLTNSFVPCNGRFPLLITLISLFFAAGLLAPWNSLLSTVVLTAVIVFSVLMTFLISKILSKTILRGMPSSFVLELPPYRVPQFGRVIVRSLLDRTVFVLGRAAAVAAPAGLLIWLLANITLGEQSLLCWCASFLDPVGHVFGMDGAILLAFVLGFPANEIVLPILLMIYLAGGSLVEAESLPALHGLLVSNGWTWLTAVCVMLFSLMHWPCSTSCLTLYKETRSVKWTLLAMAIPAATGLLLCFLVTAAAHLTGLA